MKIDLNKCEFLKMISSTSYFLVDGVAGELIFSGEVGVDLDGRDTDFTGLIYWAPGAVDDNLVHEMYQDLVEAIYTTPAYKLAVVEYNK